MRYDDTWASEYWLVRLYDWVVFKLGSLVAPLSDAIAVRRGVRLLDRKRPGWATEVDPDLLNLSSDSMCVLGQIYGSYSDGLLQLDLTGGIHQSWRRGAYWHGFINNFYSRVPRQRSKRWRKIIQERRPGEKFVGRVT